VARSVKKHQVPYGFKAPHTWVLEEPLVQVEQGQQEQRVLQEPRLGQAHQLRGHDGREMSLGMAGSKRLLSST